MNQVYKTDLHVSELLSQVIGTITPVWINRLIEDSTTCELLQFNNLAGHVSVFVFEDAKAWGAWITGRIEECADRMVQILVREGYTTIIGESQNIFNAVQNTFGEPVARTDF
jgi:hypothetical protein